MRGKYEIEVYDRFVAYRFEIKRNITIIQGDSGTGKTQLIRLIEDFNRGGVSSGITLHCEKECIVPNVTDLEAYLRSAHDKIFFIDENNVFIRTKAFAEIVNSSDNYFVLICRDDLPQLSYSVDEIYGMKKSRETQKYISVKRTYNELYHIYNVKDMQSMDPDIVVTEDSNAGYDCFKELFRGKCVSANGKSSVTKTVTDASAAANQILAIVDGAAYGADMQVFVRKTRNIKGRCALFAPESFEYILLSSGVVKIDRDILEHTYDYADSIAYSSWERYFTKYLTEVTEGSIYHYQKKRLNPVYLTKGNLEKIRKQIPEIVRTKE